MPRTSRSCLGGYTYHVLNRGNGRARVFHDSEDFDDFVGLMSEANLRIPMRLLSYCLLPDHFHLALWPRADGDLSRWMHWLMTCHVRRYVQRHGSRGHIWEGRFRSFPVQEDEHLLAVLRYIERSPLRAGLVDRAEAWRWSSLHWSESSEPPPVRLQPGPIPRGPGWSQSVNAATDAAELQAIRESVRRGRPYGSAAWVQATALALGLESSLRPRGRPRRDGTAISPGAGPSAMGKMSADRPEALEGKNVAGEIES